MFYHLLITIFFLICGCIKEINVTFFQERNRLDPDEKIGKPARKRAGGIIYPSRSKNQCRRISLNRPTFKNDALSFAFSIH